MVPLQGRQFKFSKGAAPYEQLRQFYKRATCPIWWKAQLKRACVRAHEAKAVRAGKVCKRTREAYCSDETVRRRAIDIESNAAMLDRTEIEAADGTVINLRAAFDASTSNKGIRRGELMTRIRGCEEWASAAGMVGLFTTNTAPSRFHSVGGTNPKYDGSTPRDSQNWLCKTWAACRSKLKREGVRFFGFRVAEPHHDGCAHWHMLLWCDAEHVSTLRAVMHKWWRLDEGDEEGAGKRRCLIKTMEKGGAAGYVAKYVAKNIDDFGAVGVEGHRDELESDDSAQGDMFGGNAKRVEAWASAWGIRQFQAFGQPPITAWRELRRVEPQAVQGASQSMRKAHEAVNRKGERRACFRTFLEAQGGPMSGRGYRLRVHAELVSRDGRYGSVTDKRPVGMEDAERPGEIVLSSRKTWKPRGTWSAGAREEARIGTTGAVRDWLFARPKAAPAWTRVNNCTRAGGAAFLMQAGIVGAQAENPFSDPGAGGRTYEKDPPCPKNAPSPLSLRLSRWRSMTPMLSASP